MDVYRCQLFIDHRYVLVLMFVLGTIKCSDSYSCHLPKPILIKQRSSDHAKEIAGETCSTDVHPITSLPDRINTLQIYNQADETNSAECQVAWNRVEAKLAADYPSTIIALEFSRFLGVVETKAGVLLPDFMLGVIPSLSSLPESEELSRLHFSYKYYDDENRLMRPNVLEELKNLPLLEVSRGHEMMQFKIRNSERVVSIPTNIGVRYPGRRMLNFPDGSVAVAYTTHGGTGYMAFYTQKEETAVWVKRLSGYTAPLVLSSGPGLSHRVLIAGGENVGVISITSTGLAINVFRIDDGDLVLKFATHDRALESTGE